MTQAKVNPINHPAVRSVFDSYPAPMRERLLFLRQLIYTAAAEADDIGAVTETTKWGQPSYIAKKGSTIRLGWGEKRPDHYAVYFTCNTTLVETFKELYRHSFTFEGKRAIVFHKDDVVPINELKHCLTLAFRYHRMKHLPLLGAPLPQH